MIAALSTGEWGMSGNRRKKGVAQMLLRYTNLFMLSYMRKVSSSASLDASNSKIVSMRLGSG